MARLFATSDLHLTLSTGKDMSRFSPVWKNHTQKIQDGWKIVEPNDVVMVVGDISWATSIEEAHIDFLFIESLPGKKLLSVGNHDYWYQSSSKSNAWFLDNYNTIIPLVRHDNIQVGDDISICAIKGSLNENHPDFHDSARRSYNRELWRLENTLKILPATSKKVILGIHYPPIQTNFNNGNNSVLEMMKKYKVDTCVYGHLHADETEWAFEGKRDGIDFKFVAADFNDFCPIYICDI